MERVLVIMNPVVFGQTDKCTGMRDEENKSCWTHLLFCTLRFDVVKCQNEKRWNGEAVPVNVRMMQNNANP